MILKGHFYISLVEQLVALFLVADARLQLFFISKHAEAEAAADEFWVIKILDKTR